MSRLDFRSATAILREHFKENAYPNQSELAVMLFSTYIEQNEQFSFDNAQVCRWFNGQTAVSPQVIDFYCKDGNFEYLDSDIEEHILPLLCDVDMCISELFALVVQDFSVSAAKKDKLTAGAPYSDKTDMADFIGRVILFGMERKFSAYHPDAPAVTASSPLVSETIFGCEVPKPCKHFCGRDTELSAIRKLLRENGKLFLSGIAGIGKSELAKAYAYTFRKQYTNTLFLRYSESLEAVITAMDFSSDALLETDKTRLSNHLRYISTLKEDTLIIIDGFNVTADKEQLLSVLLNYPCHILFTTRCNFEELPLYELKEISDLDTLVSLFSKFYYIDEKERLIIRCIIKAVHCHTLAVEMCARLLNKGRLSARELYKQLRKNSGDPHSADKIRISKDGTFNSDTYYQHIRTLFSLFLLEDEAQYIMCCLVYFPETGIRSKHFAELACLEDMNTLNDLADKGFISRTEELSDMLYLHPMIKDVAISDLSPTAEKCKQLVIKLHDFYINLGNTYSNYKLLSDVSLALVKLPFEDSTKQANFLLDMFSCIEEYRDSRLMSAIIRRLESLELSDADRAVMLNCKSDYAVTVEFNIQKALSLLKEAEALIDETKFPDKASSIYANLGNIYRALEDIPQAEKYADKAVSVCLKHNVFDHNTLILAANRAKLYSDTGNFDEAILFYNMLIDLYKQVGMADNLALAVCYKELAFTYAHKGEFSLGSECLQKAVVMYKHIYAPDEYHAEIRSIRSFPLFPKFSVEVQQLIS